MPTSLIHIVLQLEAVHLGDLLRLSVRLGTKLTSPSQDFQGPTRVHRTPREARCFTVAEDPIAEQADSRVWAPYEEKRTLPGTRADVSWFVCVTALDMPESKPISVLEFGNINPIHFR